MVLAGNLVGSYSVNVAKFSSVCALSSFEK
uniref:Uncharacterized protein n=1 Tax=Anguilla anguilla TaxID=7936 RepID=A0A0E9PCP4_ANGAN